MSKELISVVHRVTNSILPAEASTVDAAIASTSLLLTMLEQHRAGALPDSVGLSAIGHAARAAALTVEAREAHIRAHGALNVDLKKLGLEAMYGKEEPPPPNGPGGGQRFFTGASLAEPTPAPLNSEKDRSLLR